ncbi:MAG: ATP-binding cassette domain-containing protein, partial [Candidatus Sumerlaeota bacterium]|nr:ATP-binding cassette domain-containing protein [Candidatus Sumerlaeota bacterium]
EEFLTHANGSLTAASQRRRGAAPVPSLHRRPGGWITICGAREHNLKNLDVRLPLHVLCCITGVSGSGKSTLMQDILFAGFKRERELAALDVGAFDKIEGMGVLEDIILVDQELPGRSTRSNPVTYVKAYDTIRELLAATREARHHGVAARDFSFNVEGGRCEQCEGTGVEVVDMYFLADVEVVCSECDGKRFQRRVLEIEFRGKNINAILDLTVDEALRFFADQKKIVRALKPLAEVGLGYIRLGQNTTTLSGGEAQRLKLAAFLGPAGIGERTAFLFDEPTTGLHASDLEKLIGVLQRLVDDGASVFIIEHNLDLIGHADHIIDLGPEGGDAGGRIVAQGTVEEVMACSHSLTGQWLAKRFRSAK